MTARRARAPATAAPAAGYLAGTLRPARERRLGVDDGLRLHLRPVDVMQDYVTAQVAAMRSYSASLGSSVDRIGFAWDPSNTLGLSTARLQCADPQALAAAIAAGDPAATDACGAPWCTAAVDGAAFTPVWSTFGSWTPTTHRLRVCRRRRRRRQRERRHHVQLQIGPIATPLPVRHHGRTVDSSSPGGSFATSPAGPWSPTLAADHSGRRRRCDVLHARHARPARRP